MNINQALLSLDPANDEHWTARGQPQVGVVAELIGVEDLKRLDIEEAAPGFNRTSTDPQEHMKMTDEEILAAKLSDKQSEMGELTKEVAALSKKQKTLGYEINWIGGQLDKARSNRPSTDVQHYLAGQNELRAEKANRLNELNITGMKDILESVSKSPIDVAFNARKPARGSQRPNKSMTI